MPEAAFKVKAGQVTTSDPSLLVRDKNGVSEGAGRITVLVCYIPGLPSIPGDKNLALLTFDDRDAVICTGTGDTVRVDVVGFVFKNTGEGLSAICSFQNICSETVGGILGARYRVGTQRGIAKGEGILSVEMEHSVVAIDSDFVGQVAQVGGVVAGW
eukprot:CAMPEP_0175089006 /NCGR_PEP_ID=MMETSP0086_2-20121207/558_1 /TAXON_ID=136419 /ORGANISM="Unknown Unknown, Strain D1" /LENGTH=156 /DNA_ID=CAMNT_0016361491 /DNA_START=380 /DNA_END=847 /DNA_ORIENTATION=-